MNFPLPSKQSCIALLFLALGTLSACGQKGPLYVPEEPTETQQTEPKRSHNQR